MSMFASYAAYYDLLYSDKDYRAETDFIVANLRHYAPAATDVLELGCGTGSHVLLLAEAGYRVDGVDLSQQMLDCARGRQEAAAPELAARVRLRQGDARMLDMGRTYHAATSLFHVMSYHTTDEDLANAIRTARRHLPVGSPFIFDFWNGPAVLASGPQARSKQVENESYRVMRQGQPVWQREDNIVRIRYRVSVLQKSTGAVEEFDEDHPVRYFFQPELERQLQAGGFRVAKCAEWLTERPPSEASFSAYIVAIAE
jgi:SAM-dependent methyltransferase